MRSQPTEEPRCADCRHFVADGDVLERTWPGLLILSSAFGDTRGDQGLCQIHSRLLTPQMSCEHFELHEL